MNVFIPSPKPEQDKPLPSSFGFGKSTLIFFVGVFLSLVIGFVFLLHTNNAISDLQMVDVEIHTEPTPTLSVVELMANSYEVPAEYMKRLAEYLGINKSRFGGIGLFSIRQEDLSWIQDRVLSETKIDLNNEMQNAQVAAYLLRRFHDSGYSWKESFLIYTFGFSAIHSSDHQDFIYFVFGLND